MVRVRFAPSPTGEIHLGNFRTAIVNFITAKRNNGMFLLRIEDTDASRSKPEYTKSIIDKLNWLGMYPDEQIIVQSECLDVYTAKAKFLYEQKYAYYCNCAFTEETKQEKCDCRQQNYSTGVLRLYVQPNMQLKFQDVVYGEVKVNSDEIEDFALVRTDGMPTYMLCVVVDDIRSNITHVIRGEDHLINTFKQLLLYAAFNSTAPAFAHLPTILGTDGKKLSKRNGGASVEYFKSIGVDPKGLLSYLPRLGWSHGNQEYFTLQELLEYMRLEDFRRSAAKFDIKKLLNCSAHFIRSNSNDMTSFEHYVAEYHTPIIGLNQDLYTNTAFKCSTYLEMYNYLKFLNENTAIALTDVPDLETIAQLVNNIQKFDANSCQQLITTLVENKLHKQFRLIITGASVGPDLFLSAKNLGLTGIQNKINFIRSNAQT
jgi:glutamyl/glutaminyl-tRNA synthetase